MPGALAQWNATAPTCIGTAFRASDAQEGHRRCGCNDVAKRHTHKKTTHQNDIGIVTLISPDSLYAGVKFCFTESFKFVLNPVLGSL